MKGNDNMIQSGRYTVETLGPKARPSTLPRCLMEPPHDRPDRPRSPAMTPAEGQTTTPSGADVDPLAVLDETIAEHDNEAQYGGQLYTDGDALKLARTAVAALLACNAEFAEIIKAAADDEAINNATLRRAKAAIGALTARNAEFERQNDEVLARNVDLDKAIRVLEDQLDATPAIFELLAAGERVTAAFRTLGRAAPGISSLFAHKECEASMLSLNKAVRAMRGEQ